MEIQPYFKMAIDSQASDLHLVEGSAPALRIAGELVPIGQEPIPYGELRYAVFALLDKGRKDRFDRKHDLDISMEFFENRFRINLHNQEGKIGLSARLIQKLLPRPETIGFTETIYRFSHLQDGLVLVTGPSGSGKSTTLAALIEIINKERRAHIVTIEDPVEYVFNEKQCIIEQRELGRDTESFSSALKSALRQDPNVIMVGEMRDLDTIRAVLTAAQTGHLVLSTLHTATAAETVSRIIDYFPIEQQHAVAAQLATMLRAVISQQLLPRQGGGLVAAREILVNNAAVTNLIKTNQFEQINNVIQTSLEDGMITMNKSIDSLLEQGLITGNIAANRKRDDATGAVYY